ncbi:AAA family ATPase [Photobacterium jeanii]|uniref:AAA family ATPase n=1 Tax=Photobacterium jeanii TaxID=858640 RepID=A0A178KK10_9GAMM|nr:AAA family ATPase [Photobacterium jeanii]PST88353.1 NACHT domain-containing protein [Photobacterium jeanii]
MVGDLTLKSLDLDSQIQLLSRIQFLTRFSSNLVQISGQTGAGKTWLAQRYLESWAKDHKQALLLCHPSQSDAQHRTFILNQLVSSPLFNEQDPLLQSIERMMGNDKVQLLLVIDDAHLLSPTMIAELWALVVKAQTQPHWQVNILLFSQTGRLNKYLSQVSHGQGQAPLELEIGDLSQTEVLTFIEVMFATAGLDATARRHLKEQAMVVTPRPGALMRLNDKDDQGMANTASRRLSPALLVTLLAVVIGAAAIWLFLPTDKPASTVTQTPASAVDVPLDVKPLREVKSEPPQSPASPVVESAPYTGATIDDTAALPPEVKTDGLTVGRRDEGKRVVVPAELVDGLIAEQAQGGSGEAAVRALSPELEASGAETVPVSSSDASTNTVTAPEPVAQSQPNNPSNVATVSPSSTPVVENRVLGQELKQISSRQYALQLAALKSLSAANSFIAEHGIKDIAEIYETRRSDEPWFIIVTGQYNTVAAARRAERGLPQSVRAGQPWVKSYRQIHIEIDRVK